MLLLAVYLPRDQKPEDGAFVDKKAKRSKNSLSFWPPRFRATSARLVEGMSRREDSTRFSL